MIDLVLPVGQSANLQTDPHQDVRVHLSVTGAAPLRLVGVLLDEQGKPVQPAPLLTWRLPSKDIQIELTKNESIRAILHTAAVCPPIHSILFIAAPYGREFFQPNEKIFAAIVGEEAQAVAIESMAPTEIAKAVAICEIYHSADQGVKVLSRSEWRHRELTVLLERLGLPTEVLAKQNLYPLTHPRYGNTERGSLKTMLASAAAGIGVDANAPKLNPALDDVPAAPTANPTPATTASVAAPAALQAPPPSNAIELKEPGAQQRFIPVNGKFGNMEFKFSWHQRLATRAAVKLDVGCFWETQDDQKGQVSRTSEKLGNLSNAPFVAMDEESKVLGSYRQELLHINGIEWNKIRRILFYAAILEGPTQWDPLDGQIKLAIDGQPDVVADILHQQQKGPVTVLLLIENRAGEMRISTPGGCYDSHFGLDSAFGFQLGWQNPAGDKKTSSYEPDRELTWTPRAPKGLLNSFLHMFFSTSTYLQAEDLMCTTLAAAALVLIADGTVTLEGRHQCVDSIVKLPIGKYFSEFEVRSALDRILVDLKQQRAPAENFIMEMLTRSRGTPDVEIIIAGMRSIAMLDGQVTIREERMVERLTRYLQATGT